jgi:TPR repeat protein
VITAQARWLALLLLGVPSPAQTHRPHGGVAPTTECHVGVPLQCEALCGQGSTDACVTLARMLTSGAGVAVDYARAYALASAACKAHHVVGCGTLAELYLSGRGVSRDVPRGVALLRESCEGGDGLSCESLGGLYFGMDKALSQYISPDLPTAALWWDRACGLGVVDACVSLGAALADGVGGKRDGQRAARLLSQGCDASVALACKLVADMYASGQGVQRDPAQAKRLRARACDLGYRRACGP